MAKVLLLSRDDCLLRRGLMERLGETSHECIYYSRPETIALYLRSQIERADLVVAIAPLEQIANAIMWGMAIAMHKPLAILSAEYLRPDDPLNELSQVVVLDIESIVGFLDQIDETITIFGSA